MRVQDTLVPVSPFVKEMGYARVGETRLNGNGTIASGAGSAVITHGLGGVPIGVIITPQDGFDAPFEITRADLTETTFTVRYKGGVLQEAGTTGYFLWEAVR